MTIDDMYAKLSESIPNFEKRQPQVEACEAIYKAFEDDHNCLIEGPCGFGKTFSYLLPAIALAPQKTVIATSGIALQEQLYYKDLPNLKKIFDFNFCLIKGKNNFACMNKVEEAKMLANVPPDLSMLIDWAEKSKTKDISDLSYVPDSALWAEVSLGQEESCEMRKCPYAGECGYAKSRFKLKDADIIVCNYHILFSDIQADGNILGKYDYLIMDEAHEAAEIARNFFETKMSLYDMGRLHGYAKKAAAGKNASRILINATKITDEAYQIVKSKFADIKTKTNIKQYETISFAGVDFTAMDAMLAELVNFTNYAFDTNKFGDPDIPDDIARIMNKVYDIREKIDALNAKDDNSVKWLELSKREEIELHSKYKKVDKLLDRNIFQIKPTLLTSATLSSGGNFDYVKREVGLTEHECVEIIAQSPFDLKNQQLWYLPQETVNVKDLKYQEYIEDNILDIIKACNGGVLALFTSYKAMNEAYQSIAFKLCGTDINILKQGDKPKQQLLEDFAEDKNSVLFGTRSMFTGVDIPGDSLRCVVIDKLPFKVPTDPVSVALKEMNTRFFYDYSIPDMCITLMQMTGRGVRSKDDKCIIAILDNRVSTASYKMSIARCFPYEKTLTRDINDVKKFIDSMGIEPLKEKPIQEQITSSSFDDNTDFNFNFCDIDEHNLPF